MYMDYEKYIKNEKVRQWVDENCDEDESVTDALTSARDDFFTAAKNFRGGVEERISDIDYYDIDDWIDDGLPEFSAKKLHHVYDGEDRYYLTLAAAVTAARETLAADYVRARCHGRKNVGRVRVASRKLPKANGDSVTISDLDAIRDTYNTDDARILEDFLRFVSRISEKGKIK